MKKFLAGLVLGGILGAVVGAGGMLFYFPFLFPPAEVNEQVADADGKQVIASGSLVHPDPTDTVHWGKGSVDIYQGGQAREVFFRSDFEVGPGPAYRVYLLERSGVRDEGTFLNTPRHNLGILKSFRGSQVYKTPADVDFSKIKAVAVWCESFDQLITVADLI